MKILESQRMAAYRLGHRGRSAWLRLRYGGLFDRVERFCLFAGYPRSGHSIVGALLNAHKDAVISHELIVPRLFLRGCSRNDIYSQIIARANWFNRHGNTSNYRLDVPGQYQGRFESLRVIGDKRGGGVSLCLIEHPDFLRRVRALVGVPLRLVNVVRNPYDNIAAISIWHQKSLPESADVYFRFCQGAAMLEDLAEPEEVISIRHEEFIAAPQKILANLCAFLELELYPGYLDDCCATLFRKPTFTRRRVSWDKKLIDDVAKRASTFPMLRGYSFELEA